MPQQTLSQTRLIDPILSEHARGYVQPGLIARQIFPVVPVTSYGGQIIEFGKEAFRLYNTKRAPGANTKRIQFGYEGKPYSIQPSALEAPVPRERMRDAAQVPGFDLGSRAVNLVLRVVSLEHEAECAKIALDPANYGNDNKLALTAGNRWTHPDSDPFGDVETAKEAIADQIGIEPNRAMFSRKVLRALRTHPKVIERFKHVSVASVTVEMLQTLFDIDSIVIGQARLASGANDAFSDVWGLDAWFGYVNDSPSPQQEEPSYGYTYAIEGHPLVEEPYYDKNAKSWIYGVSFDQSPVLSGMAAGYLLTNAGAAHGL